jgi:CubicO group peptidase (beta-lactamase class C family)
VNLREDAIYRIASMTKPIIAVAMLLLYEEGRWQLDDPVTKFIPEFADLQVLQDGKLVPLDRPMTMRHLMASSAGFAFGPAFGSTNPKVDEMYAKADLWSGTNDDIIPKLAKLPLEAQPGTLFRYGLQQEVQGAVLRRISGEQLDTFLERRVFAPLGMKDTGFDVAPDQRDRIAPRYALDQNLKLILAPDQSPFPAVAGTPPRGEAEIPAVDRRALLNGTRLHAFCADAGQSRYARRRPDAVRRCHLDYFEGSHRRESCNDTCIMRASSLGPIGRLHGRVDLRESKGSSQKRGFSITSWPLPPPTAGIYR